VSQTRRSFTSPPKIEAMSAPFPEPSTKRKSVSTAKRSPKSQRVAYRKTCAGSSMSVSIGRWCVCTRHVGVQRSKPCHQVRGICYSTRRRGICLQDRGADSFGLGRRRCQDV
jgi:hypothetical protein